MENPATWGKAEKVIDKAIRDADKAHFQGIVGLSTTRRVADALREAGLLDKETGES
jgi:hypothetical protein